MLTKEAIIAQLVDLIEPLVSERDTELVGIEVSGPSSNRVVRVFIYRKEGMSLGLCVELSREIGDLLDLEDPLSGRYRLEVTSPGLDRPLKTDRDFSRGLNRRLKIVMVDGHNHMGKLVQFDAEILHLTTPKGPEQLKREAIAKATIEAEI